MIPVGLTGSPRVVARRPAPHQCAQPEGKRHHPEVPETPGDERPPREGVHRFNPAVLTGTREVHVPRKGGRCLQLPGAARSRQLEAAVKGGRLPRDDKSLPVALQRPLPAQPATLVHRKGLPVGNKAPSLAQATETDLSRVPIPFETIIPGTNTGWNATDHVSGPCSPELPAATTPMERGISTAQASDEFLRDHGIVISGGIRHGGGGFG